MAELLRRTLGEQVRLHIDMPANLWPALADDSQLESAVLNLAINARDAMPYGGDLRISSRNVHLSETDLKESAFADAGDYVEISVSDTGLGIPSDVLARVSIRSSPPSRSGRGQDWACRWFTASFNSPAVTSPSKAPRAGERPSGSACRGFVGDVQKADLPATGDVVPGRGETVLVIEDDVAVRLLVVQVLDELGYEAIETSDGREAVPILESGRHIDLMISDVGLPGLNGRQLAEIARRSRPTLPILFMTGYAMEALDQSRFLDDGMEMITKPFAIDAFGGRIQAIMGRSNG